MEINTILNGDALTELKKLPDNFVDCIITSPPYWALRDYKTEGIIWDGKDNCEHDWNTEKIKWHSDRGTGKRKEVFDDTFQVEGTPSSFCSKCNAWKGQLGQEPTIDLYINHLIQIFNECKRILKKEGTCWVVLGDTYAGNGINRNGLSSGTCSKRVNLNNAYPKRDKTEIPEKSLCLIPERFVIAMSNNGWIVRSKPIWFKPNCMPSSAKDRFTVDYENIYFFTKSQRYYFNTQYEPLSEVTIKEVQRFYNGKGIKDYEGNGVQNPSDVKRSIIKKFAPIGGIKHTNGNDNRTYSGNEYNPNLEQGRIKRCVWKINTKPFPEAHFAVFPEELVKQCLDAGCPPEICKKCGSIPELRNKSIYEQEQGQREIFNGDKSKPYSVQERTGTVSFRKLPDMKTFRQYINEKRKENKLSIETIEKEVFKNQAPHHWFSGESYPTIEDWYKLKKVLNIPDNNVFETAMTKEYYKPADKVNYSYVFESISRCNCSAGFESGIVLDPFMGSGTVALVALKSHKQFLGIELNPEYIEIANKRLEPYINQQKLEKFDIII